MMCKCRSKRLLNIQSYFFIKSNLEYLDIIINIVQYLFILYSDNLILILIMVLLKKKTKKTLLQCLLLYRRLSNKYTNNSNIGNQYQLLVFGIITEVSNFLYKQIGLDLLLTTMSQLKIHIRMKGFVIYKHALSFLNTSSCRTLYYTPCFVKSFILLPIWLHLLKLTEPILLY